MSEVPLPVQGILLTHGSMCFGMVDAVLKISGVDDDALIPISNEGQGPDSLYQAVADTAGERPTVIFTDLQTGSCALAARFVCRSPGKRRVVFGANLAMLLDFVFHRDLSLDELVDRLVETGRASIRTLADTPAADAARADQTPSG